MNLNALRYIVAVADTHSISLAAKAMLVTQPTVSQCIRATEKKLGARIFDRSTIPLTLTAEGHAYVEWARNTLLTESQMRRQIDQYARAGMARLSVGIAPHRSSMFLPDIIEQLVREFPKCRFFVKTALVADLYKALDEKDLDVIVTDAPEDAQPYSCIVLSSESILLAVPSAFPVEGVDDGRDFPIISIQKLANYPFIGFETGTYLGACLRLLWELESISPRVQVEVSHVDTAIEMAARGLGSTVVPEFVVRFVPRDERLNFFYIDRFSPERQLTIVHKKNRPLSVQARRFIELFAERYGDEGALPRRAGRGQNDNDPPARSFPQTKTT